MVGHAVLLLVAHLMAVLGGRRAPDPRFAKVATAVANWSPCSGVSPWELSTLEDADIMYSTHSMKILYPKIANRTWENGTVPFHIEKAHFDDMEIATIRGVIRAINELSCVKFWEVERLVKDYIRITGDEKGCYSELWGRKGGLQIVNLQPPACVDTSTVFHTLFHALGFRHMHCAIHRDNFIRIVWNNIHADAKKHFEIYQNDTDYEDFGLKYDYDSVMHFSRKAHSINGKDTIQTTNAGAVIGRKLRPSVTDVAKLRLLYDC